MSDDYHRVAWAFMERPTAVDKTVGSTKIMTLKLVAIILLIYTNCSVPILFLLSTFLPEI